MREKVTKKVIDLLTEIIDDEDVEITEESSVVRDLELSSLELSEMLAGLNKEFGMKISDTLIRRMKTVSGIVDIAMEHIEKR